jgi:hypothetical protein
MARPHNPHRLVQVTLWVKPSVKRDLRHYADQEGLKLSRAASAALEGWIAQEAHMRYSAFIEAALDTAMGKWYDRLTKEPRKLAMRTYYSAEHSKAMLFNVLRWRMGLTEAEANAMIDGAKEDAQRSTKLLTAEINKIIAEIIQGPTQAA